MRKLLITLGLLAACYSSSTYAGENNFTCNFISGDNRHGQNLKYSVKTNQYNQVEHTYISLPLFAIATGPSANNGQFAYRKQIMVTQMGNILDDGKITSFHGADVGKEVSYNGQYVYGLTTDESILSVTFDSNNGQLNVTTGSHPSVHKSYHMYGSSWQCYKTKSLIQ
jgi:hypothetical protein